MSNSSYSALAPYYDRLMVGIDYAEWADFMAEEFAICEKENVKRILDMGCGTGRLTLELAQRGYDMIGSDISEDMLAVAQMSASEKRIKNISFIMQDMRRTDVGGGMDAVVCMLDGLNYLTGSGDLLRCFRSVYASLNEGGFFIFDVCTPFKYENVYSQKDYILEDDGVLCAWSNDFNSRTGICNFIISLFTENRDGSYSRYDELQRQRRYSASYIKRCLLESGFSLCGHYGALDRTPAAGTDERWFFTARKINKCNNDTKE